MRLPISSTNLAPSNQSQSECSPQYVRIFRELAAVPTLASVPSGPFSKGSYALPRPGPTLRARVGELVQLTFINQVNPVNFGDSIDRGETGCRRGAEGVEVLADEPGGMSVRAHAGGPEVGDGFLAR